MSLSRRGFVRAMGVGGAAAAVLARVPRAFAGTWMQGAPMSAEPLLLHNNENPMGPGAPAIEAMRTILGGGARAGRYPFGDVRELPQTIAEVAGVPADRVMIGNGSTQLLRTATHVFTSPTRPLVAGALTYEECAGYAEVVGHAVETVPLREDMSLDLDGMAQASRGAGMVFLNNPNNPTAIVHSEDEVGAFIETVLAGDPDVMIMVDEAYHDYVTAPAYKTAIPHAVDNPRVLVARTFSKAHGMAGMRIGYIVAHPDTIATMRRWHYGLSLNVLAMAAASVSIRDEVRIRGERDRNTEARDYTREWFAQRGFPSTDSQTNFVFVETRMPAQGFRDGCREQGIRVGRNFPPFENTHARISIGTLDQMRTATAAFARVLGVRAVA